MSSLYYYVITASQHTIRQSTVLWYHQSIKPISPPSRIQDTATNSFASTRSFSCRSRAVLVLYCIYVPQSRPESCHTGRDRARRTVQCKVWNRRAGAAVPISGSGCFAVCLLTDAHRRTLPCLSRLVLVSVSSRLDSSLSPDPAKGLYRMYTTG